MPLNKLENFIKNTEGRILYVNPSDLDSTDAIENQGNSLTKPFKTIQRALLEAARFSYLRGSDNDIVEKTTILLFPGEHIVDNRPGFGIRDNGGPQAVSRSGAEIPASTVFNLTSSTVFDLTQENNILYKFNSIHGGVVVPRGTSIVGLDLRKTKIRPKYVPNPTDPDVDSSAIFRITGACYFWQFTIFDGDDSGEVYTDPTVFTGVEATARPRFSHHKLTAFEYADGVNIPTGYAITDLDMYYSKLSNAYNTATARNIDQKWPDSPLGFTKKRPEWEIVGAFAADPLDVSSITSGDGSTASNVVTIVTETDHGLSVGTPVKINGASVNDYNVSSLVQTVVDSTTFTLLLEKVPNNANGGASSATVTVESDTVSGASPYIFNISMRSVWGMNGMHADGSKAAGFRSMVVAQYTAVSLQKDDRAFVKYNPSSRGYDSIPITKVTGSDLSRGSSSTNPNKVYHLDQEAIYRSGWETSHIKASNDSFIQVVSVFAIGFTFHFDGRSGADFSITNSNSNFGQFSLNAVGFKAEAFSKDNKGYITSIITPKAITSTQENVEWVQFDTNLTTSVGISSHLYLFGYTNKDIKPPVIIQGYRVGAKLSDDVTFVHDGTSYSSNILMVDNEISETDFTTAEGTTSSVKEYRVSNVDNDNDILTIGAHGLLTGEKIIIISDDGDLPENIDPHRIYYAIKNSPGTIKIASSFTNAKNDTSINITGGSNLKVLSRVSDKDAGDIGSPIQFDAQNNNWYVHTSTTNDIYTAFGSIGVANIGNATETTFIKRTEDTRSLDEKLYKIRVVVPKELTNGKDPEEGFIIQESSSTGATSDDDFTTPSITSSDYNFNRNPRFISTCSVSSNTVTVVSELPHNLTVNDEIVIKNVKCSNNTVGTANSAYNGVFTVATVDPDGYTFTHSTRDTSGVLHVPGNFTDGQTYTRSVDLPRFERRDWKDNYYIYRNEVITPYIKDFQDGIYHLYVLNANNASSGEFANNYYSQNVADLYPQLDRDNINENPNSASTFVKRSPLGDVVTDDLKKSLTRETIDGLLPVLGVGLDISGVVSDTTSGIATLTFSRNHNLSGIVTYSELSGGSGYTPASGISTYYNVKLFNDGTSTWDGATAKVVVNNGAVTSAEIITGGSGYTNGEELDFDTSIIGGGTGAGVTISNSGISTVIGNTVQITGLGTASGEYYRIVSVPAANKVAIAISSTDETILPGQYLLNIGKEIVVSSSAFTSATGITTFTTSGPHGLVTGNRIRVKDANDANQGDYLISGITTTTVSAKTTSELTSPKCLLKHGLSANDKTSDVNGENIGARGLSFYGNETATLVSTLTTGPLADLVEVEVSNSGISTTRRFELGSYIQIGEEIMRVKESTLTGSPTNKLRVIRGALGTLRQTHLGGSLVKKITPKAVEFRRPTYLRASGHTFEYLGYGPGNYSTSLPQVQNKTLSEKEDYLAQSQEKSGGIVVYTGMNNDGDFFIGNKKINSSTGKEKIFDIPTPTITGEDLSNLSVVFDEVIVKQRLVVEGGNSGTVLSQFDGPTKFNKEVKVGAETTLDGKVKVTNTTDSTSVSIGALVVDGGVGVGKTITAQDIRVVNEISAPVGTSLTLTAPTGQHVAIQTNTVITGILSVTDDITAFYTSDQRLKDNVTPIEDPLAKVLSISGNTFDWNEKSNKSGHDVGLIAQEINEVLPEAVTTRDNGYLAVDYQRVVPLLVEAIKKLTDKVDDLEQKLSDK